MAYLTTNPPALISKEIGRLPGKVWFYTTTDAYTTIDDAGYFSNAGDLGMSVGDMVIILITGTGPKLASVISITAGAATVAVYT